MFSNLRPFRLALICLAVLVVLPLLFLGFAVEGGSVVHDPDRLVHEVHFDHGGTLDPLRRFPFATFVGLAKYDGELVVVCSNGRHASYGYVTSGEIYRFTVTARDCDGSPRAIP